jgi:hypothetical protein
MHEKKVRENMAREEIQASVWHEERKTRDKTEYYLIIRDGEGERTISFVLRHDALTNEVLAEPYSPPDINYTIHDGCDHANDECVLEDPESWEAQDVAMAERYGWAVDALEKQIKQAKIADELRRAKAHDLAGKEYTEILRIAETGAYSEGENGEYWYPDEDGVDISVRRIELEEAALAQGLHFAKKGDIYVLEPATQEKLDAFAKAQEEGENVEILLDTPGSEEIAARKARADERNRSPRAPRPPRN